ncbi:MAG: DNA repair protein RecO [Candidatus Nealsonbacteria bacterium RIFOXYB1_FULL_40_15]|uniref:DNA repair protein RecO n=2 Tax=Candidatus Nealsoniibacteriota TaxID=1817911 RepID=A0A1G2EUQ7_9BACT|nr:MAG: DNA repair protein RecO [Candidatus Nealsonbacteria bacterium RIFOXYB1_FULL_40_15]OGZ28469.1 MAG: DNA repair protein RecO [Candidatus Nealsonbacteria bacterium RIFOXYD1_FULL_39_11]OGZ29081.1 MAG: DNA repair protein RecO [Candidatus Nealsonbacteria bacterium RIFOXYC1_FULL_40_7]
MANHYRTKAVVLSKKNVKEADQLFSLFSEDFGKISVLGRGIRKITSKLRSGIDTFYFSEVEFIQGKEIKTLTDTVALDKFHGSDRISEATEAIVSGQEKDRRVWDLLMESLGQGCSSEIACHFYFWNLLSISGYGFNLGDCLKCGRKLPEDNNTFSFGGGGIFCSCSEGDIKISANAIKLLRIILRKDWKTLARLSCPKTLFSELDSLSWKVQETLIRQHSM